MIPHGFTVVEEIHRDDARSFVRARRPGDEQTVLLTAVPGDETRAERLAILERERDLLSTLEAPAVPRPRELLESSDPPVLVLADVPGVPLSRLLAGGRLDPETALGLAVELANSLEEIHRRGLVLLALEPRRILFDPDDGRVTILNVGSARPAPGPDEAIGGELSLAYVAPEQTGRIEHLPDPRSDLYSLGVTLYEALTGRVPFDSSDPLELVHAHVARVPPAPHRVAPDIPDTLGAIVERLLAKSPDERYQTASGLASDLERCLIELREGGITPFVLGRADHSRRFIVPRRLYGRRSELAALRRFHRGARRGGVALALVSGQPGVGKTALVHAFRDAMPEGGMVFISGKFDLLERSVPYGAIAQALQGLARRLLTESDENLLAWRETVLAAVGPNAGVVLDVAPELESVLGPQPPVPRLGPTESQNRFSRVFQQFLSALATRERPVVLFLDDLQWADPASLRLMRTFLANPVLQGLLVIGAYRDNEVDENHPLRAAVEAIESDGVLVQHLAVAALDTDALIRFVAETLRGTPDHARPLAELVKRKTAGNPFFVGQFLRSIHAEGHLALDPASGRWNYDLEGVRSMGITENVVDLLVRKLERLPASCRRVLQVAACVGNRFEPSMLATASGISLAQTVEGLEPAIREGLIVAVEDALAPEDARELAFLHDRVQQAAYDLIPPARRAAAHLDIARLLVGRLDPDELESRLFDLVDQLNQGIHLVEDPAERRAFAGLDRDAGCRAKASTAYQTALEYFCAAADLLGSAAWEESYPETFALHLEIAECRYLCGHFEEAERDFARLLDVARSPLDAAEVHLLRVAQHETRACYEEAVLAAGDGLRLLGIPPPSPDVLEDALAAEVATIDRAMGDREVSELLELPPLVDPRVKTAMRLLSAAWAPAYIVADAGLIAWIPAILVRLSIEHGNTEESAIGYAFHGITLGTRFGDYQRGYEFGALALRLNDALRDLASRAKVHELFACFVNLWRRPLRTCFEHARESYRAGVESGDFAYATYGCFVETWYGLLTSSRLSAFAEEYGPRVDALLGLQNRSFADAERVILNWAGALRGVTRAPDSLDDEEFNVSEYLSAYTSIPFFQVFPQVARLHLALVANRYEDAVAHARDAGAVIHTLNATIWPMLLAFYRAVALAAVHPAGAPAERAATWASIQEDEERLARWAEACPENFRHAWLLVRAERARLLEARSEAEDLYEAAVAAAGEAGFPAHRALALERYARFWLDRGHERIGGLYLRMAHDAYAGWGAEPKARALASELSGLGDRLGPVAAAGPSPAAAPQGRRSDRDALDSESVLRMAQAIASETDLARLLAKLMRIWLETAGAQRGALILDKDGESRVQASGSIDEERIQVLQSIPVESSDAIPRSVIDYVRRTLENVVLEDATDAGLFGHDPFLVRQRPRSLVCVPILYHGQYRGAVYLENSAVRGAFGHDRVALLRTLSTHAAIAIVNAELFQEVYELRDRLMAQNVYLMEEIQTHHGFEDIVGESEALGRVIDQVERVAPTSSTVLLLGETGTGKELIARAIHALSSRKEGPLVVVNCGAISAGLVESELFGHEKGAFTGAMSRKIGRFEAAHGGTIFLDEIGELAPDMQVRLLRVLQEGEIARVGSHQTIEVDVRVIAATNRDLAKEVETGGFRSDLYYRLNVFPIQCPPLRERREDIPLLVRHFVLRDSGRLGRRIETIPERTLEVLMRYSWPGNVRELRNVIERSMITSPGTSLELGDWFVSRDVPGSADRSLAELERSHILRVLEETGWVVSGPHGAARRLGLKPTTLEARMKKFGIVRPRATRRSPNIS